MKIRLELNIIDNEEGEESIFLNFWNHINGDDVTGEFRKGFERPILYKDSFISLDEFINQVKKSFENANT